MKCLLKYRWVKLPRAILPQGKGVLGQWAKLAARAAYRKGVGRYCGFENPVEPGMWAGGVVGLKSILGTRSRKAALGTLERLQQLGFLRYSLDPSTKKLEYTLLDLWCHTVWQEPRNIFSHMAPTVQFGSLGAVLTLETLGRRWGWEKTKVWRFFKKHEDALPLYRLPGSYGCLVFNAQYPTERSTQGMGVSLPSQEELARTIEALRFYAGNAQIAGTDNLRINKMVLWYSKKLLSQQAENSRVAISAPLLRAYPSPCWNCRNCKKDCKETDLHLEPVFSFHEIPALFDLERKVSHERQEKFPELYDPVPGFDRLADRPGPFGGRFHSG